MEAFSVQSSLLSLSGGNLVHTHYSLEALNMCSLIALPVMAE